MCMDNEKIALFLEKNLPHFCQQLDHYNSDDFWNNFRKFVSQYHIFFIGETHGTKEIPKLTIEILKESYRLGYRLFCMEVPRVNMKYLEKIDSEKKFDDFKKLPMYLRSTKFQDGRSTYDHLNMIYQAIKIGYKVGFFDMDPSQYKVKEVTRSVIMANNFHEIWEKEGKPKSILFSAHSHGHPIWFDHNKEHSVRYNLNELQGNNHVKIGSIFVLHGRGSFWNVGLQEEENSPIRILVNKFKPNLKNGFFDMRPDLARYNYVLNAFGMPLPLSEGLIYLESVSPADLPKLGFSLWLRRKWHLFRDETI